MTKSYMTQFDSTHFGTFLNGVLRVYDVQEMCDGVPQGKWYILFAYHKTKAKEARAVIKYILAHRPLTPINQENGKMKIEVYGYDGNQPANVVVDELLDTLFTTTSQVDGYVGLWLKVLHWAMTLPDGLLDLGRSKAERDVLNKYTKFGVLRKGISLAFPVQKTAWGHPKNPYILNQKAMEVQNA